MKRIFSLATTVLTVKSLWWDKLSSEDKRRYTNQAKDFFEKNKEVITQKGREFSAARQDAKAHAAKYPDFYVAKKSNK